MKPFILLLAVCLWPLASPAQVIVHQAALDQLAGILPPAPVSLPVANPAVVRHIYRRPVARVVAKLVPKPVVPVAPPPAPVVRPAAPVMPVVAPLPLPKPPPTPAPAVKPAPPLAPVVVAFAPGADDLPGGAASSLAPICKQAGANGIVAIDAYAPADASDPSVAMRLSLSRAFAVRDALTGCGIPAAHIIPRADGAAGGNTGIARVSLSGGVKTQ